jgi:hypothetical protein
MLLMCLRYESLFRTSHPKNWLFHVFHEILFGMSGTSENAPPSLEFEVLRPDNWQKIRGKRPSILDRRCFVRICKRIQLGSSTVDACLNEGVTYRRLRQLCASRPIYQKRYEKAEALRFNVRRERMEALVIQHAEQSWQAAIAWLERNIPAKWALKVVPRVDPSDEQSQPEIPAEVLARHRALMLELARQDECEAARRVRLPENSQFA